MDSQRTKLTERDTGGLGEIVLDHPRGTFPPSPATRATARAVGLHRALLGGQGIDWGCGVGALAIAAARIPTVAAVTGLDVVGANVAAARANAARNGVAARTRFFRADSFGALAGEGRRHLRALRGRIDFVIANPPASTGDDGFSFRRRVLTETRDRMRPGGVVLMQALSAYGPERVENMVARVGGFVYEGPIHHTEPAPLDLSDPRMMAFLDTYVTEEARGGIPYAFFSGPAERERIDATEAVLRFRHEGRVPWARWQVHLFRRVP